MLTGKNSHILSGTYRNILNKLSLSYRMPPAVQHLGSKHRMPPGIPCEMIEDVRVSVTTKIQYYTMCSDCFSSVLRTLQGQI